MYKFSRLSKLDYSEENSCLNLETLSIVCNFSGLQKNKKFKKTHAKKKHQLKMLFS